MVFALSALIPMKNGAIDLEQWLTVIEARFTPEDVAQIRRACSLVQSNCEHVQTKTGQDIISYGVELANLLLSINLDKDCIIAAILYPALQYTDLTLEDLEEQCPAAVTKLLQGTLEMDSFDQTLRKSSGGKQIDNYRRMLLAMVDDMRIVLLKLAERTLYLRHIRVLSDHEQVHVSQQIVDIYAPLANRLGIFEFKWELEDLSFQVLHREKYKTIAKQLNERRIDRDAYVSTFKQQLTDLLATQRITAEIMGRAKHIYSIHRKMSRKDIPFADVTDTIAVRILVGNIDDCYAALSLVHNRWDHHATAFTDHIAHPKQNGYQSIHTVIQDSNGRKIEVQMRTHTMHEKNERGVAAHWVYKEGAQETRYQRKIAWLRQLLEWQLELASNAEVPAEMAQGMKEDRIYVFTPTGDVVSLPQGSTPLDYAYYIHSEVGHKCRGAKINNRMVPLTYALQTGEQVDILTVKNGTPSRDWLNSHLGYLTTARAKTKVHNWFKKQDHDHNIIEGQAILQRELKRLNVSTIDAPMLAPYFHLQSVHDLLAALGNGDIRIPQLVGAIHDLVHTAKKKDTEIIAPSKKVGSRKSKRQQQTPIRVSGMDDLLTHIAHCCKPIPGEPIGGYITLGRGITVHRLDCANFKNSKTEQADRIVDVSWGIIGEQRYNVDLTLEATPRHDLLRDLTKIVSEANLSILQLNAYVNENQNVTIINLSVEITGKDQLSQLQSKLASIKGISTVRRQ
ncbi:MAG: bifunctional (p)ppGpp synthetase/guanosine-3',5'-bis(diphosphate) 3'-pyrophosphohydrolase [Gammaproteobacteria bacterium]|nr:bifunctional (p)ppGpp synthetase/guanosine-3',5'-bis(diphosphate) 3'-pyrophosphohydrolase [Gammaproteobacteria bacterium]